MQFEDMNIYYDLHSEIPDAKIEGLYHINAYNLARIDNCPKCGFPMIIKGRTHRKIWDYRKANDGEYHAFAIQLFTNRYECKNPNKKHTAIADRLECKSPYSKAFKNHIVQCYLEEYTANRATVNNPSKKKPTPIQKITEAYGISAPTLRQFISEATNNNHLWFKPKNDITVFLVYPFVYQGKKRFYLASYSSELTSEDPRLLLFHCRNNTPQTERLLAYYTLLNKALPQESQESALVSPINSCSNAPSNDFPLPVLLGFFGYNDRYEELAQYLRYHFSDLGIVPGRQYLVYYVPDDERMSSFITNHFFFAEARYELSFSESQLNQVYDQYKLNYDDPSLLKKTLDEFMVLLYQHRRKKNLSWLNEKKKQYPTLIPALNDLQKRFGFFVQSQSYDDSYAFVFRDNYDTDSIDEMIAHYNANNIPFDIMSTLMLYQFSKEKFFDSRRISDFTNTLGEDCTAFFHDASADYAKQACETKNSIQFSACINVQDEE